MSLPFAVGFQIQGEMASFKVGLTSGGGADRCLGWCGLPVLARQNLQLLRNKPAVRCNSGRRFFYGAWRSF